MVVIVILVTYGNLSVRRFVVFVVAGVKRDCNNAWGITT
jgi:hypothetical protein